MIPKYLQTAIGTLKSLKRGMTANAEQWTGQPVTTGSIDDAIEALEAKAGEIADAQQAMSQAQKRAHDAVTAQNSIADQVENLARGIHHQEQEKLTAYDIAPERRANGKLPVPGMVTIASIKDDVDGEGFILSIQPLANCSDFEIQRSESAAAGEGGFAADSFTYLAVTKKLTYTDDNVTRGKRYFYRVRGFNRTGKGEWSAVVSRVQ